MPDLFTIQVHADVDGGQVCASPLVTNGAARPGGDSSAPPQLLRWVVDGGNSHGNATAEVNTTFRFSVEDGKHTVFQLYSS